MKKTMFTLIIIIWGMLLGLPFASQAAAQPADRIQVEVSLMDDFGFLLADYRTDYFTVEDNQFVYQEPPDVAGYTFATVNVLKLETEAGYSFRVNYFYTQDELTPASLPDPVPLDEIPLKRAQLQRRPVWVSWIDESGKELSDTRLQTWDFFWETYVIPKPLALKGFAFSQVETGMKKNRDEEVPHFAFVYSKGGKTKAAPSLIFEHLIEDRSLRTIPRETIPDPSTAPGSKPQTRPSPQSQPTTKPESTRQTKPGTTGQTKPWTQPTTVPATTSPRTQSQTGTRPNAATVTQPGQTADPEGSGKTAWFIYAGLAGLFLAGGSLIYQIKKKS